MTKSEFYKQWYSTRFENQTLQENGYPNVNFKGDIITTEDQWTEFLETELEPAELAKLSEEAADMLGVEYVEPYWKTRIYPEVGEQLDGIYKSLKAIKDSGVDIGTEGSAYVDEITTIKTENPKN